MKRILIFALIAVLAFGIAPAAAQTDTSKLDSIESYIQELMALYNVPGVGMAIVKDGKIIYENGLGVRDTTTNTPTTANTLFQIGSITKSFTALGVMQLVEEGKLDLDKPIIDYFPDFKLSDAEATKTVTLRMALSHTTGLPRAESWYFENITTREEVIKSMADIALSKNPGEEWQYNNQNFVLAGYLIERVTGQTWEDYTRTHILEPLGMKTADFDPVDMQKSADYATPHRLDLRDGMIPIPFFPRISVIAPAGAISASAHDMAEYALFQLGDGSVNGKALVSEKSMTEMHRKQIPITSANSGEAEPLITDVGYGFGWINYDYRSYKVVEHDGSIDGFTAALTLVPSEKLGVILLTNASAADLFLEVGRLSIVDRILDIKPDIDLAARFNKAAGYDPAKLNALIAAAHNFKPDTKAIEPLLGDYDSVVGRLVISARDGKYYLKQTVGKGDIEVELVPFELNKFALNGGQAIGSVISMETDKQGAVTLYQNGQEIGKKVSETDVAQVYKDVSGHYSFTVPAGYTVISTQGIGIIQTPEGLLTFGTIDAKSDDLQAEFERFAKQFDPTFKEKPSEVKEYTDPKGQKWTMIVYALPSQVFVVNFVRKVGNTVYATGFNATGDNREKLMTLMEQILGTFEITQ